MRNLGGVIVRCGLMVLPLCVVIMLCCLMFGFRGQAKVPESLLPPTELAVQNALIPSAEAAVTDRHVTSTASGKLAAFERLHILHARLNVPN